MDILSGYAQHLGCLHGDGGPSAADIGGAFNQANSAVGVDRDGATGLEADVEPESRGHTAAAIWTLEFGVVLGRILGRFQTLNIPDYGVDRSVNSAGALLGGVHQPEFQRV